ncbi:uncharacterized protein LOC133179329 [Saccostrea echinata]|uniref:uncharacterized protein LOC133179329 n=1 Tax=Saccostrea echinata TaxID=191078 RepID=UPI002A7FE793|nr:uncharacterized protein LOC133179329 [Saccostrea echinata]
MGGSFSSQPTNSSQETPEKDAAKRSYVEELLNRDDDNDSIDPKEPETSEEDASLTIDLRGYVDQFPFENLVFEGGGAKGVAYPGAIQALEELGLMRKIKRFAGTSIGSITACLAALGYNSQKIREVLEKDFRSFYDARLGQLSLLPNMVFHLGWQPMNTLYEFLGELVKEKLGNKDATFQDLYIKTGKELCIVVMNVNNLEEEYFHLKTTPNVPLRVAMRMSASLPGLMQPVHYSISGQKSLYMDGGILANYPISCFDGWWLSMKKEDSFYKRLQPMEKIPYIMDKRHRFARDESTAAKTLGFVLYGENEQQSFRAVYESRQKRRVVYPDTNMGRKAAQRMKNEMKLRKEHALIKDAINKFIELSSKFDENSDATISRDELTAILNDKSFTESDKERLFGKGVTVEDVINRLDKDGNGKLNFQEVVTFIEEMGFAVVNCSHGFDRQEVTTLLSLIQTIYTGLSCNLTQVGISSKDLSRTVGINTHYIGTTVFDYEKEDVHFLNKESYKSTMAFLKYFVDTNMKPKETQ